MKKYSKGIKTWYEAALNQIQNSTFSDQEKTVKIFDVERAKLDKDSQKMNMEETFRKTYIEASRLYNVNQEKFNTKVANAIKTFNKSFAKGPKALIGIELEALQFRKAWAKLDEYYTDEKNAATTQMNIRMKLMDLTYNEKQGLEVYIYQLTDLYLKSGLPPEDDNQKVAYLIHGLQKSSSHPFKDLLSDFSSYSMDDYSNLVDILRRKESEVKKEKRAKLSHTNDLAFHTNDNYTDEPEEEKKRKFKGGEKANLTADEDSEEGGGGKNSKAKFHCTYCDKDGHTADQCRQKLTCSKCGKKGHEAKTCRVKGAKGKQKKGTNGNKPPSLRKAFEKNKPFKGKKVT
jgi:hypothetical protein